ncbi:DUF3352 domain-containing protein [Candidatus Poribacteria bacterium]|nr:DUF3352 domain-containing protein [Candidatus Poribacteria bacterium]
MPRNLIQPVFAGILICLLIAACSSGSKMQPIPNELPPPEKAVSAPTEETPSTPTPPPEVVSPPLATPPQEVPSTITPPSEIVSSPATSLMNIAPSDALLVLQIKDVAEALALIEDSRAWQQLIEAPAWEMLWAAVEMQTEIRESHHLIKPGLSILSHVLGQEILLVVPKFRGILEISPTLLVQLNREDDLGEILSSALQVALANIPDTRAREYGGYSYLTTGPIGPNLRLSCGVIDDILIASLGEATIRKVIDLHRGESTESLANDTDFSQLISRFQGAATDKVTDFQTTFHIELGKILEFAELMYPMARSQLDEEMQPMADEAIKWLDLVESITSVSNLTKDGFIAQSYVEFNPNATSKNFLAMLQVPPTRHDSIKFAAADSGSYGATNLIDLPKLWGMAMGVIQSLPPEVSEQILGGLDTLQTQFGIDIEEDLLSWMGSEIAAVSSGDLSFLPRDGGNLGNITTVPDFLLLIQTTDSMKAAESLGRLADLLGMTLGAMVNWETMQYLETDIHTAQIPDAPVQPSYAVTDGYVLIATQPSSLKAALDCAKGNVKNLLTNPGFQELRAIAPEMVNSISYANPGKSLEKALDTFVQQFEAAVEEELSGSEDVDFAMIQPILHQSIGFVKEIVKTLVGQLRYTVKDGDGLRSFSFLKVQDLDASFTHQDSPEAQLARSLFIARGYEEKGMSNRSHAYLDRVLEIDPDHPEALMMKISLLESEGNEKRANWYRRKLGFPNESAWYIVGPFPNPDSEGFDTVYPPETGVDVEDTYETESGEVAWKKRRDDNRNDGFVNFKEMFEDTEWKVAYAWTTVTAPESGEVELRVGSDDDVKVWVNGTEVLINQVGRPATPDEDGVHVSLNQGPNQILVKVCNRELDWGFYLRFTDENQRPIKGLTYGN